MAGNILNIGKSALFAAQAGMSTAGHNIANVNVPGYTRQGTVQATGVAQNTGIGFVGSGTYVADIKRYSDNFLNGQVRQAQTQVSSLDAYYSQVSQIDNLLADTTSGLSPALQDFFKGVQDLAANPASVSSRQAMLSAADAMAARFQGMDDRLQDMRDGINTQITANVSVINTYATQIAKLNEQIAGFAAGASQQPNDLMDQRDQLVADLNKQINATVVAGDNNSITVSIGTGQPLVVGTKSYQLAATPSPTDVSRLEIGIVTGSKIVPLAANAIGGGELGGLMEFRAGALDRAQNSLGRIAIGLAATFNAQHKLGLDSSGQPGQDFFVQAQPLVTQHQNNNPTSTTALTATISDPSKLTQSDYKVNYDGSNFKVTRLSDNKVTTISPYPQVVPQTIDGVDFSLNGAAAQGDSFLVRPTIRGADQFAVALTDRAKIAAAGPVTTNNPVGNIGSAKISEGSVTSAFMTGGTAADLPVTLTFDNTTTTLSGFPAGRAVTATIGGVTTTYPAGTPAIPYAPDAKYSFGGLDVSFTGTPGNLDTFRIGNNTTGVGDNRNMRALGALQTTNVLDGGTATFQSAYAEMVNFVGNKTREVQVNGQAGVARLASAVASQQSVSGVNMDEEAANLIKYQQAYQAAGKVMQIAGTLFETLLSIR